MKILTNSEKSLALKSPDKFDSKILKYNKMEYLIEKATMIPEDALLPLIMNMTFKDINNLMRTDKKIRSILSKQLYQDIIKEKKDYIILKRIKIMPNGNLLIEPANNLDITDARKKFKGKQCSNLKIYELVPLMINLGLEPEYRQVPNEERIKNYLRLKNIRFNENDNREILEKLYKFSMMRNKRLCEMLKRTVEEFNE